MRRAGKAARKDIHELVLAEYFWCLNILGRSFRASFDVYIYYCLPGGVRR